MGKVNGIPSLVVLGPDGAVTNKNARGKIAADPDASDFPWHPLTFNKVMAGAKFQRKDGTVVEEDAIKGKTVGIYFSAHWCPPCRQFTPKLASFYEEYKKKDPNFEIIFSSGDNSEEEMVSYFKESHGDYLCFPYDDKKRREQLDEIFEVEGIPTFVVVDANGKTLNANARALVGDADAVAASGWEPPLVGDLGNGPEACGTDINETATLIVRCAECSADEQKGFLELLTGFAKQAKDAAPEGEDPAIIFMMSKSNEGVAEQLAAVTSKNGSDRCKEPGEKPHMLLFDIPDNGGFYESDATEVTKD